MVSMKEMIMATWMDIILEILMVTKVDSTQVIWMVTLMDLMMEALMEIWMVIMKEIKMVTTTKLLSANKDIKLGNHRKESEGNLTKYIYHRSCYISYIQYC